MLKERVKNRENLGFNGGHKEISNCRESGRDGNFFGELIAIRFSRPDSPVISLQADLLTPNSSAIKAIKC
ncbi:hypothetical protein B0F88_101166 [Methylobacter tundripaludum]|uniref:Uncharacterized protein n=1 Tax=Methylobacter tundripaludum TaxID=173365 RepID=A0A2S6H8A8_9GAMM|nr:hypothetical protein B0F88_101166 [Methylobacter tundripaludum]